MKKLSDFYYDGQCAKKNKNDIKAIDYKKASDLRNLNTSRLLGICYAKGKGV